MSASLLTSKLPAIFISLILFIGGIVILALRIPGWGLFLGIPAVQIGTIFLIFNFDEVVKNRVGPWRLRTVYCPKCGKSTLAAPEEKEKLCQQCEQKMIRKLKKEA